MSKQETLLVDGLRSELILQHQLKTLSETLRQQLLETERRHRKELDMRINENALLSTDQEFKHEVNHQAKHAGMRRSTIVSALTDKETSHHHRQSERINTSSLDLSFPTNQKHYSIKTSMLIPTRAQRCERLASSKTTQMKKEEEDAAECQKKFCAHPIPCHVIQPYYQEMMELREKERKKGQEQRRAFLLSIQKPFDFQERETMKKEKLVLNQVSKDRRNKTGSVSKLSQTEVNDSSVTELKNQELCRQVTTQRTVRHENPIGSSSQKCRTAERTRKEKLAFLYERPSFQPKIIHQVPDFSRLHKAWQKDTLRKTQNKEEMKCQPFNLRTSALPTRRCRMNPENIKEPKINTLARSKSLGNLTSLSSDTLPLYITDAVRKRCMATRKSIEIRDKQNHESADWLRKYQMRSQAMEKTITLHAKLLDPHSSLKEVHNEKLQHHRLTDQQRMREYMRHLRDMKARVSERPYLFEQVKQKNAKAHAEQVYRNKLKKAGIKEQFVEENGEAAEGTSISSGSEDDTDKNDIHNKNAEEENVDDREKTEDVEGKSVKSNGEEMP